MLVCHYGYAPCRLQSTVPVQVASPFDSVDGFSADDAEGDDDSPFFEVETESSSEVG